MINYRPMNQFSDYSPTTFRPSLDPIQRLFPSYLQVRLKVQITGCCLLYKIIILFGKGRDWNWNMENWTFGRPSCTLDCNWPPRPWFWNLALIQAQKKCIFEIFNASLILWKQEWNPTEGKVRSRRHSLSPLLLVSPSHPISGRSMHTTIWLIWNPFFQGCIAVNYWYDMQFDVKYNYFNLLQNLKGIIKAKDDWWKFCLQ